MEKTAGPSADRKPAGDPERDTGKHSSSRCLIGSRQMTPGGTLEKTAGPSADRKPADDPERDTGIWELEM